MNSFYDLTDDGGIKKKVLKEGFGENPKFGQKVLIHFIGKIKSNELIFSNTNNGPPFEFEIGSDVISGLSTCIASMKCSEKSIFEIAPMYAYGNNEVNHCNIVIPPNSTLIFEIELVELRPFFANKDEAIQSAEKKCQDANDLFRSCKYNDAIILYQNAVKDLANYYGHNVDQLTIKVYRNLSVSYAKLENWKLSLYNANKVLKKIPNDLRALARAAEGSLKIGNTEDAKQLIDKGLSLSNNNSIFLKLREDVTQALKDDIKRKSELLKKMTRPSNFI